MTTPTTPDVRAEALADALRLLAASMRHSAGQWMVPGWDGHKVADLLQKAESALKARDAEIERLTTTEAFAALMPEPAAYCEPSNPDNSLAFAWPGYDRRPNHTDSLYTAEHMRAMFDAATERAAKLVESGPPPLKVEGGRIEIGERARKAFAGDGS